LIPDELYPSRIGTTDSEAVFLAMMGAGLEADPLAAAETTLRRICALVNEDGHRERLRFTSALTNGRDLYAFRFAENDTANTLYFREESGDVVVVSEPLDRTGTWIAVPSNHVLVARYGCAAELQSFSPSSDDMAKERTKQLGVVGANSQGN
jgi:predicted glutamine amidotransferase